MGEAKRRQQLDPNFGKSELVSLGDIAKVMYRNHGKGILFLSIQSDKSKIAWILPSQADISDVDKGMINECNYQDEFVISRQIEGSQVWQNEIVKSDHPVFDVKVGLASGWDENTALFVYA